MHTGSLAPGGHYADSETVTLPVGISGTYHLFVTTDVNHNVPEGSGETNDSSSIDLPVALTPSPDLQVTSLQVPNGPWSGQPMSVQWTVTNTGQGSTRPNETAWTDRVYLSDNGVLDTSADTLLGSFPHNGGLAAGASYTQSQSLTLPVGISGPYTLFVVTDATNSVYEGAGESNNVTSQPLTVNLTSPPDLQVGNISAPAGAYAGQPITINWMVTNIGTGPTVPGAWTDAVYLSRDQFLDPTADLYLGSVHHDGTLIAGASYSANLSANVPAYASGPYYVFVLTDSGGAVFEGTAKANNTAFDPTATVVTFAPPADLVVANITVPPSGVAGQAPSPSITWTVTNQGTNPAVGSWYDSVYLSPDGTWSVSDPLIDSVLHTGDLAPGASYTASTTAPLPAVVPGNYHVIVRTNILNNVRETDKTNNLLASASTIAMDVPELPLDVATPATIANNQDLYYRVDTTAGQNVLITSSFNQPGQAEFYVRYGAPPTRGQFDEVYSNLNDLNQTIALPHTQAGTYYILLHGREGAGTGTPFSITAKVIGFQVQSVTPDHGSNLGQATVTLVGAQFTPNATVSLVGPDGTSHTASRIWWKDANTLWATFDLTGLTPAVYDVRVDENGQTTTDKGAFTVTTGAAGAVQVHLVAPGAIRPGASGQVEVVYTNTGDTDVPAPLMDLSADIANLSLPNQAGPASSTLQLLGINTNGPAGILPPGASGSIVVDFQPTNSTGTINFSVQTITGQIPRLTGPRSRMRCSRSLSPTMPGTRSSRISPPMPVRPSVNFRPPWTEMPPT